MWKKAKAWFVTAMLVVFSAVGLSSCQKTDGEKAKLPDFFTSCFGKKENATEYTLMYSDGVDTHMLTVEYGSVFSLPTEHIPQKEGYKFLGWFDSEEFGKQYVTEKGMCTEPYAEKSNLVLYPQFEANEYKLVFHYGFGEVSVPYTAVRSDEQIVGLPTPSTSGEYHYYAFEGWYTQENGEGEKLCEANGASLHPFGANFRALANQDGTLNVYANYKAKEYTAELDPNGGTLEKNTCLVSYGSTYTLPVPTRSGYAFLGWNEETDDLGKSFLPWTYTYTKKFTARWIDSSVVSFNVNADAVKTAVHISTTTANTYVGNVRAFAVPTAEYYEFKGWYSDVACSNGNAVTDEKGEPLEPWTREDNCVLYAKWVQTHTEYAYVASYDDFSKMQASGKYMMINHINFSGKHTPLSSFSGVLEGNGYTISGITGFGHVSYRYGLFCKNTGTIRNLQIKSFSIDSGDLGTATNSLLMGFVCAENTGTIENIRISNCTIFGMTGSITTSVDRHTMVGGIAGKNTGTISKCGITGSKLEGQCRTQYKHADSYVGGIVGKAEGGSIVDCYSRGNTIKAYCKGSHETGWLDFNKETGSLDMCSGGVVGRTDNTTLQRCLGYRNSISAVGENVASDRNDQWGGSLIGKNGSCTMSNCYSEQSDTLIGSGSSTGASKTTMNISTLNFPVDIWRQDEEGPVINYLWK